MERKGGQIGCTSIQISQQLGLAQRQDANPLIKLLIYGGTHTTESKICRQRVAEIQSVRLCRHPFRLFQQ
jgi:hypothetical protein